MTKGYERIAMIRATFMAAVLLVAAGDCFAADVTTLDGKIYEHAKVAGVDPGVLVVLASGALLGLVIGLAMRARKKSQAASQAALETLRQKLLTENKGLPRR